MYQPVPGLPYQDPHITVREQELRAVDSFTYLGSTLSRVVNIDIEINNRIPKASATFAERTQSLHQAEDLPCGSVDHSHLRL